MSPELAAAQAALGEDCEALRAIDEAYGQLIARATEQRRQVGLLLRLLGPGAAIGPGGTAEAVRARRFRLRLSQGALAAAAGVSRSLVCDLERRRRRDLRGRSLAHLDRVLTALEYRAQGYR